MSEQNAPLARLEQIAERLAAITPGEWHLHGNHDRDQGWISDGPHTDCVAAEVGTADGSFIAAAPADVRWLLDEVKRLIEHIESIAQAIEKAAPPAPSLMTTTHAIAQQGHRSGYYAAATIARLMALSPEGESSG